MVNVKKTRMRGEFLKNEPRYKRHTIDKNTEFNLTLYLIIFQSLKFNSTRTHYTKTIRKTENALNELTTSAPKLDQSMYRSAPKLDQSNLDIGMNNDDLAFQKNTVSFETW